MYRIGQSTDIHRFCDGNHIILGGIEIPSSFGIEAHSDGDALCHAIAEAILGALALGDLGSHFADTDACNKNRSSLEILSIVVEMMEKANYEIGNIDALILIEKPKMAPYITKMREALTMILHTEIHNVSIKATRGERLGFIGREEGLVCQCVVLLKRSVRDE